MRSAATTERSKKIFDGAGNRKSRSRALEGLALSCYVSAQLAGRVTTGLRARRNDCVGRDDDRAATAGVDPDPADASASPGCVQFHGLRIALLAVRTVARTARSGEVSRCRGLCARESILAAVRVTARATICRQHTPDGDRRSLEQDRSTASATGDGSASATGHVDDARLSDDDAYARDDLDG